MYTLDEKQKCEPKLNYLNINRLTTPMEACAVYLIMFQNPVGAASKSYGSQGLVGRLKFISLYIILDLEKILGEGGRKDGRGGGEALTCQIGFRENELVLASAWGAFSIDSSNSFSSK